MSLLIIGIVSFVSTNLDDLVILILLFSSRKIPSRQIVMGQFIGISLIILISWLSSALTLHFVRVQSIKYFGVIPICIGLVKFFKNWTNRNRNTAQKPSLKQTSNPRSDLMLVVAVTLANGGDNIAVYGPLFAKYQNIDISFFILIYLLMTALWCVIAFKLASKHPFETRLKKHGDLILPWLWIGLGIYVLV